MRGKGRLSCSADRPNRITPAYAGKSQGCHQCRLSCKDHPRVCGEKASAAHTLQFYGGSPPRMRGKAQQVVGGYAEKGITPAYAGKSGEQFPAWRVLQDHPRVCGEKCFSSSSLKYSSGSPPRMRGKGKDVARCRTKSRITPAYAGKSLQ